MKPTPKRVACEALETRTLLAATDPFTFVVMPDTQYYSKSYPHIFDAQTQWIAGNRAAQNMQFLTHVGDVVETPSSSTEWTRADTYMDRLDASGMPYSVAIGNHDYEGTSSAKFVQWFGPSRYAGKSWYGGASSNGINQWQVFTGGPWNFLHITLEYNAGSTPIAWAQQVINAHPGMPTMITTHDYISTSLNRSTVGTRIWEGLVRKNPQIFMVMNGHYTGEAHRVVANDAGKPVIEMVVDFQGYANGGDGYLRLLQFHPTQNRIDATTYSPWLNNSYTDANSRFSITMDFAGRFGPPTGARVVTAEEVLVPSRPAGADSRPDAPQRPAFSARKITPARKRMEVLQDA